MGLLNKLTNGNTTFGFGGAKPPAPTATNTPQTFFDGSNLDLDGVSNQILRHSTRKSRR